MAPAQAYREDWHGPCPRKKRRLAYPLCKHTEKISMAPAQAKTKWPPPRCVFAQSPQAAAAPLSCIDKAVGYRLLSDHFGDPHD